MVTRNLQFADRTWSDNRFTSLKLRISIRKNMRTKVNEISSFASSSISKKRLGKDLLIIKRQQKQPYYHSTILNGKSWKTVR